MHSTKSSDAESGNSTAFSYLHSGTEQAGARWYRGSVMLFPERCAAPDRYRAAALILPEHCLHSNAGAGAPGLCVALFHGVEGLPGCLVGMTGDET